MSVTTSKSGISTGALIGIVLGGIAVAVTLSAVVTLLILRVRLKNYHVVSKRRHSEYLKLLKLDVPDYANCNFYLDIVHTFICLQPNILVYI